MKDENGRVIGAVAQKPDVYKRQDIEENQKKHIDRLEIEKLNHEWNNAQRKYERYNGKRK